MKSEIQDMRNAVQIQVENITEIGKRLKRLEVDQSEIRKELYGINRKILGTYTGSRLLARVGAGKPL